MPSPALGWDTFFAVGNESVWATLVARTKFFEHAGFTPNPGWAKLDYPAFRAQSEIAHGRGLLKVMPELTHPGNYTGLEYLLYHLFGKAPVITTPGGGTLAREQVYTFDDSLAALAGLSGEARYGFGSGVVKPYTFNGMKVLGVTINFNEDKTVEFVWRFACKSVQPLGSPTSATYPERLPMWWDHITAKKGGVAFDFRSASIEVDLGYDTNRRQMGSYFIKEPVKGESHRKVTWKLTTDFEDPTIIHDAFLGTGVSPAESVFSLVISSTNPNANSIESGQTYLFEWTMPTCYIDPSNLPIVSTGIVANEISGWAERDTAGATEVVSLKTRNKVTAVP